MPLTCFLIGFLPGSIRVGKFGLGLMPDDATSHDAQLRQAAFDHVNRLAALRGGVLDAADLAGGFDFGGERIPLINP
jgi:hypothetical protein